MQKTRVAFLTGHEFGRAALDGLLASRTGASEAIHLALLAGLDRADGSKTVGYTDIGDYAPRAEKFCYIRNSMTTDISSIVESARPDFVFVIGWSRLVPAAVLDIPARTRGVEVRHGPSWGAIGMHPTLLPEGRGRAPIPWAIIKGLAQTGVTAFLLEETADSGGILAQERISITRRETATTLFAKAKDAHTALGEQVAKMLCTAQLSSVPQDERRASTWPKRRPRDGKIDFAASIEEIDRLVRALTPPYPGAFVVWEGAQTIIHEVRAMEGGGNDRPGTVIEVTEGSVSDRASARPACYAPVPIYYVYRG